MRIIGGKFKRHLLRIPPPHLARPTSDRTRESIFNIINSLMGELTEDMSVLDAFAGSGALGLEALSRGIGHAYFMEINADVMKILTQNIEKLGIISTTTVFEQDATKSRNSFRPSSPMTLLFLDPPYGQQRESACLLNLYSQGWIDAETLIVLETSSKERNLVIPEGFQIEDQRHYGAAKISFIRCQVR